MEDKEDEKYQNLITQMLKDSLDYLLVSKKPYLKVMHLCMVDSEMISLFFQNEENQVKSLLLQHELPLAFLRALLPGLTHRNCKLESLMFMGTELDLTKIELFKILFTMSNCTIRNVVFTTPTIRSSDVWLALCEVFTISSSQPTSLWFDVRSINDDAILALKELLAKTTTLTHFGISDLEKLSASHLRHLLLGVSQGIIQSFHLPYCNIQPGLGEMILEVMGTTGFGVSELALTENQLDKEDMMRFKDILTHPNNQLHSLKVGYNTYNNHDALLILEALSHHNCKLQILEITLSLEKDPLLQQEILTRIKGSAVRDFRCLWEGSEVITEEVRFFRKEIEYVSEFLKIPLFDLICSLLAAKMISRIGRNSLFRILSIDILRSLLMMLK
jgi:hypothetical protein